MKPFKYNYGVLSINKLSNIPPPLSLAILVFGLMSYENDKELC